MQMRQVIRPCASGGGLGTAFARLRALYGHEPATLRRLRLRAAVLTEGSISASAPIVAVMGGVVDGRLVPRLSGSTTVCPGGCKERYTHSAGLDRLCSRHPMHVARARVPEVVRGKSSSGFREWQSAQLCRGRTMVVESSEEGKKVRGQRLGYICGVSVKK